MLCLISKSDNLGFYRRAIPRAYALYLPVVKGRVGQAFAEYAAGFIARIYGITLALTQFRAHAGQVREMVKVGVTGLRRSLGEVDCATVKTHRRACLHSVGLEAESA